MKIEPLNVPGLSTKVLYAPEDIPADSEIPFVETSLISGSPDGNLVYRDSPFEIRVAGMLVQNFDKYQLRGAGRNELVMYSVQTDPKSSGENGDSLPFIHFDHRSDAYQSIERANTYVPIPASKAYVTGSELKPAHYVSDADKSESGTDERKNDPLKSVNVRFKIIELDTPSETVKQAIAGIDMLGGVMSEFSMVAPALGLLSPALTVAGAVSKHALDSYARPDKVFSMDMDFLLADRKRVENGTAPNGEYLRYGYYFFLNEPMEGKLYASVLTPKNVQLMLRRCDTDHNAPRNIKGEPVASRKFFPLTQVSYLVVRVCEPIYTGERKRRPIQVAHARQLEDIFSRSKSPEDPEDLKRAIRHLGQQVGFLNSDTESE